MQHENLRFDIEPPSLAYLAKPLFSRVDSVGTAQAGAALRAYMGLSRHGMEQVPGLEIGRVHVPRYKLHDWNNIPLDAPLPCLVIAAEDRNGTEYRCQIFTDRSALFMAPEEDGIGDPEVSLLRVLPVVFRLSSNVLLRGASKPWALSLRGGHKSVELLADDGSGPRDLLKLWSNRMLMTQTEQSILNSALEEEICAWAREIPKLPWVTKTAKRPATGRFGVDCVPPAAGMEGMAYDWPRAMALESFTQEEFKACRRFMQLAWAYLLDTAARDSPDGEFVALTGRPSQNRENSRLQIKTQFLGPRGETKQEATARVRSAMEHLMRHPEAPATLWSLTGAGLMETTRGGCKSDYLDSYILFHGRMGRDIPSAHDRMEAFALFKDWAPAL